MEKLRAALQSSEQLYKALTRLAEAGSGGGGDQSRLGSAAGMQAMSGESIESDDSSGRCGSNLDAGVPAWSGSSPLDAIIDRSGGLGFAPAPGTYTRAAASVCCVTAASVRLLVLRLTMPHRPPAEGYGTGYRLVPGFAADSTFLGGGATTGFELKGSAGSAAGSIGESSTVFSGASVSQEPFASAEVPTFMPQPAHVLSNFTPEEPQGLPPGEARQQPPLLSSRAVRAVCICIICLAICPRLLPAARCCQCPSCG